MADINVSFVFDDGEISELNAFKVYQAHLKTEKPESFHKVGGATYTANTYGNDGDWDDPFFVRIALWNPEINIIDS